MIRRSKAAALLTLGLVAGQAHTAAQRASTSIDVGAGSGVSRSVELRTRGVALGFNLDYPEALATFKQAIAEDPSDAGAYRMAAAVIWAMLLFEQGTISTDDYSGQARAQLSRPAPPKDLAAAFAAYAAAASQIAARRVRHNPRDADAHCQAGSIAGFQASYATTIEGRVLGGLGPARRAYAAHKRCMELDPSRKDAGLIVGMYLYGVSTLPAPLRMMARLAGFGSGREKGLRLVEEAAAYESATQTNAQFTLILLYSREGRHADALPILDGLQRRYPRNRLLWLEESAAALRAGRPTQALEAIDEGLVILAADSRPRALGEEARWHAQRGAALVALGRYDEADREMRRAGAWRPK